MWHVTDRCPLECPYCFARKTGIETRLDRIKPRLSVLKELGVLKIDVSGGEPLVYPWLKELCEGIKATGIAQTLTTSGIGTATNKDFLIEYISFFSRVLLSIDAPSAIQHDRLRGIGSFEAAIQMMNRVINAEPSKLRINTLVTKSFINSGWFNEMDRLTCEAAEWCLIQPHPANEKPGYKLHSVPNEEFDRFIADAGCKTPRKLLTRRLSQYASYWSLQPAGELMQHTYNAQDGLTFNIDTDDKEWVTCELIKTVKPWIPTIEDEHHNRKP